MRSPAVVALLWLTLALVAAALVSMRYLHLILPSQCLLPDRRPVRELISLETSFGFFAMNHVARSLCLRRWLAA